MAAQQQKQQQQYAFRLQQYMPSYHYHLDSSISGPTAQTVKFKTQSGEMVNVRHVYRTSASAFDSFLTSLYLW
jgi:hypothetical protein